MKGMISNHPWLAMFQASLDMTRRTLEAMAGVAEGTTLPVPGGVSQGDPQAPWRWTTRNRIVAELATMRIREFRREKASGEPAVIVIAPFALHAATTADLAKGHSVLAALLQGGIPRLMLTDWRSAGVEMAEFSFDNYLAELNVLVDDVGPPAALVGLCQGGLLASIYAARFPEKVSRLALAGAPLVLDAAPSLLTAAIRQTLPAVIDGLIAQGDGVLRADLVRSMWPTTAARELDIREALQIAHPDPNLVRRFDQWNADLVNLPGLFYRQTVDLVFRRNAFALGMFPALGRHVGLRDVRCPLFLLAASQDEVVSPEQVLSARSRVATPQRAIVSRLVEGRHLSLYMGRQVLASAWPDIASFLTRAPESTSGRSSDRSPRVAHRPRRMPDANCGNPTILRGQVTI